MTICKTSRSYAPKNRYVETIDRKAHTGGGPPIRPHVAGNDCSPSSALSSGAQLGGAVALVLLAAVALTTWMPHGVASQPHDAAPPSSARREAPRSDNPLTNWGMYAVFRDWQQGKQDEAIALLLRMNREKWDKAFSVSIRSRNRLLSLCRSRNEIVCGKTWYGGSGRCARSRAP